MKSERVPNAPLREAFVASRKRPADVCWWIGMTRVCTINGWRGEVANVDRFNRSLGLTRGRGAGIQPLQTIKVCAAKRICWAIDVDFDVLYLAEQTPAGMCADCGEQLVDATAPCSSCLEALELGVAA